MSKPTSLKTTDLTLSRVIAASPGEVFDVWIDKDSPGGPWFGADKSIVQPVVDGLFYVAMGHEGRVWPHYGRFVTLDRPHKIEHTWVSISTKGLESVVTLTFEPQGDKTLLTLRHTGVPDDEDGHRHKEGWGWMLEIIEQRFAGKAG
jgi:uncharacterized protein YndB with AHSA1/START domain